MEAEGVNNETGVCVFCNHSVRRGYNGNIIHSESDGERCLVKDKGGLYCGCDTPRMKMEGRD